MKQKEIHNINDHKIDLSLIPTISFYENPKTKELYSPDITKEEWKFIDEEWR